MTWGELAQATRGALRCGGADAPLGSISTDSRRLEKGEAFWVLKGDRFDAHDFLNEELADRSAGWIVREGIRLPLKLPPQVLAVEDTLSALSDLARYHRGRFDIPIVAITGSNGKTTVKDMLTSVLALREPVCATAGNFNNKIGLPLSLLELMPKHRFGVFEMGASRSGDIRHLCAVARPTIGVLTNIAPAHLEFFKDIETILKTKCELIDSLPAGAPVVINIDDAMLGPVAETLGSRAVTFGAAEKAAVRILPSDGKGGLHLDVRGAEVRLSGMSFGLIHRTNAAAAAAAALALGCGNDDIRKGLARYSPSPLRFAVQPHSSGASLTVDTYNANPASMRAGIETFLEVSTGSRRFLVLGDMAELGEDAPALHEDLGTWLAGQPVSGIFLAGSLMENAVRGLSAAGAAFPVSHAQRPEDLLEGLRHILAGGSDIYFKASRVLRLEDLIGTL